MDSDLESDLPQPGMVRSCLGCLGYGLLWLGLSVGVVLGAILLVHLLLQMAA